MGLICSVPICNMFTEYLDQIKLINPTINDNAYEIYRAFDSRPADTTRTDATDDKTFALESTAVITRALQTLFLISPKVHYQAYVSPSDLFRKATWTFERPIVGSKGFYIYGSPFFTESDMEKYFIKVRVGGFFYVTARPEFINYSDFSYDKYETFNNMHHLQVYPRIQKGRLFKCRVGKPMNGKILTEEYVAQSHLSGTRLGGASPYMKLVTEREIGADLLGEYL